MELPTEIRIAQLEAQVNTLFKQADQLTKLITGNLDLIEASRKQIKGNTKLIEINLKLAEELPVVEGMVTNIAGNRFHVNLGRKTRVKNGMKLIVYEILGPVRDPRTREVIGRDIMELGKARIKSVAKDTFCAQLIDNRNRNEICQGNIVITR